MEAFEKGLKVGFAVYKEWGVKLKQNGFEEEFLNNLLAQICFFLLTRTEDQKNNIVTEFQVIFRCRFGRIMKNGGCEGWYHNIENALVWLLLSLKMFINI